MPPLSPKPIVRTATVKYRLQPVKDAITKQIAGPNWPTLLMTFLVIVCVYFPVSSIESAMNEIMLEKIHIDKYGKADRKPFYCYVINKHYVFIRHRKEIKVKAVDLIRRKKKYCRSSQLGKRRNIFRPHSNLFTVLIENLKTCFMYVGSSVIRVS